MLKEESLLFVRVKEVYRKDVRFCRPSTTVTSLAIMVKENDLSGMVVVDEGVPVGVVTDRDLRDKVLAQGLDPRLVRVESIMSYPVLTIREEDFISEAVYKMLKNRIHRLAVVDEKAECLGVLTDTDIIKFQTDTSLYFMKDLEAARTIQDIKYVNDRMTEHISGLFNAEVKPKDLVQLISYLNDLIIVKTIKLLSEQVFGELPRKFAFLVLGSEGRMEQTLKTDQDNAIVYSDELSEKDLRRRGSVLDPADKRSGGNRVSLLSGGNHGKKRGLEKKLFRLEGNGQKLGPGPFSGQYPPLQHVFGPAHGVRRL